MIDKYGSSNGFNWRLGDTIGVQLITVPIAVQFRSTLQLIALLSGGLLAIFGIAYFVLVRAFDLSVVLPLRRLASAAEAASQGVSEGEPLPMDGVQEIAILSSSIERLRISVRLLLKQLSETKGRP